MSPSAWCICRGPPRSVKPSMLPVSWWERWRISEEINVPAAPLPLYISRFLVPDVRPAAPEGFTVVDQGLVNGLPFAIRIDATTTLMVTAPTGQGRRWPDLDPATLVTSSGPELDP